MNIDLAKYARAGVDELMRNICWANHRLTGGSLDRVVANRVSSLPLLNDEDFLIGMAVELWPFSWLGLDDNE